VLDGLSAGSWALPRSTGGTTASWQLETGATTSADMSFDQVPLVPSRISSSIIVSTLLTKQSSPDLERVVVSDMTDAIATAVDAAAINGTGVAPQPLGVMHYPVNASGVYAYGSRSANVTFGGPATWPAVLSFERILEQGLITNDGSFGYAVDPTVRDKWQQAVKITGTGYQFLWENVPGDSTYGYVNGRRSISSTQLGAGQVIFAKWSELILGSWLGIELVVDPYSHASSSEIKIVTNLLCAITLRYALAFSASADSGAQ
jgi:HK97 family phage major capsid protein